MVAAFMVSLASCGSNENANTTNSDSPQTQLPSNDKKVTQGSIQLPPETTGATGAATVSDSGNATHPGSDTTHQAPKK